MNLTGKIIIGLSILCGGVYAGYHFTTTTSEAKSEYFLFLSDIHLHAEKNKPTGQGDDTMQPLWNAVFENLKSVVNSSNPPKFIVYTGDLPAHGDSPDVDASTHEKNISSVLTDLASLSSSTIPLFYAPGNNDPLGGDYCQFKLIDETPISEFGDKLGYPAPHASKLFSKHPNYGYYAASPFKGLRIIGLNTVMFSPNYVHDEYWHCVQKRASKTEQVERVNAQLAWLREQLQDAVQANDKVIITMHIPPGLDAYTGHPMWATSNILGMKENLGWSDSLLVICEKYKGNISSLLYGHTHMDEFRRLESVSNPGTFSTIALSAPGISPVFGNNPGYKKVYINQAYEPVNFTTHYTNFNTSVGGWNNWDDSTYQFSTYFGDKYATIFEALTNNEMNADEIGEIMKKFYTVQSKPSGSKHVMEAIDVEGSSSSVLTSEN